MADISDLELASSNSTLFCQIISNTLGGLTAELFTFPLENIKTRMQMNGNENVPKYSSIIDCIKKTNSVNSIIKIL
jgi:hypothetical protein